MCIARPTQAHRLHVQSQQNSEHNQALVHLNLVHKQIDHGVCLLHRHPLPRIKATTRIFMLRLDRGLITLKIPFPLTLLFMASY